MNTIVLQRLSYQANLSIYSIFYFLFVKMNYVQKENLILENLGDYWLTFTSKIT